MSRAPGTRPPFQGVQEPVQAGAVGRSRVAPIGASTDTAEAVRGILGGLTQGMAAWADMRQTQYDELVKSEIKQAMTAALEGQAMPEFETDEGVEQYERTQGAMIALELDPAAVEMREGQSYADALRGYLDREMSGLPTATRVEAFRLFLPRYVEHARSARQENNARLYANSLAGLTSRLPVDADTDQLERDYLWNHAQGRALGWTDEKIVASTLLPAAQAAAQIGDTERVAFVGSLSEGLLPERFMQARLLADNTRQSRIAEGYDERIRTVGDPINGMGPIIEAVEGDESLDESAKRRVLSHTHATRSAAVEAHRDGLYTALDQAMMFGVRPVEKVLTEAAEYAALPIEDPSHLTPARFRGLMKRAEDTLRHNGRMEHVVRRLRSENVHPLNSDYDPEILESLTAAGIIETTRTSSGGLAFSRILDPVRWAAAVPQMEHNPDEITRIIRQGMGSSNPEDVATSLQLYATLHQTAEHIAEPMLDGMGDLARLRVASVLAGHLPPRKDQAGMEKAIEAAMPNVMSLTAPDLTPEQITTALWYDGDPKVYRDDGTTLAAAQKELEEALPAKLQDDLGWRGQSVETPGPHVVNTYLRLAAQQYVVNVGRGLSPMDAAAKARKDAARLTLLAHTPVNWDDETIFLPAGTGLKAKFDYGAMIALDLQDPRMGLSEEDVADVMDNYRPSWSPALKAFRLVDADGDPLIADNGQVFTSSPFDAEVHESQAELLRRLQEARMDMEAEGRVGYPLTGAEKKMLGEILQTIPARSYQYGVGTDEERKRRARRAAEGYLEEAPGLNVMGGDYEGRP